jgi:hypothetical protein
MIKRKILTGDERREPGPDAPMRTLNSPEIAACSSAELTQDGWTVRATWYLEWEDALFPTGPERIEVWLSPGADDETRHRGLNSTVLRRTVEPALVELIRRMSASGESGGPSMAELLALTKEKITAADQLAQTRKRISEEARNSLAQLPRPRGDTEGYYGTLLDTYEAIKASGVADPVGVLQDLLSPNEANAVPRGTVLSRLRKARKVKGVHRDLE